MGSSRGSGFNCHNVYWRKYVNVYSTMYLNANGQRKEYDDLAVDRLNNLSLNLFLRFHVRADLVRDKQT